MLVRLNIIVHYCGCYYVYRSKDLRKTFPLSTFSENSLHIGIHSGPVGPAGEKNVWNQKYADD